MKELINKIHHADCMDILKELPDKCIDLVLTDPPYPDYYADEYNYNPDIIKYLDKFKCKQIIFWTAKQEFLLDYTAIHIWDKKTGCGSMYERIFERNGGLAYKVYRHYLINSTVAESFTNDIYTGHKSQKPIHLIIDLIKEYSKPNDLILDCFSGSGTTAIACHRMNRRFICIEKEKTYYDLSVQRLKDEQAQMRLF